MLLSSGTGGDIIERIIPEIFICVRGRGEGVKDTFEREITYLRISLTDLCNLRCAYCMPPEGVKKKPREQILSLEEIAGIAREAVGLGIKKIRLTGGEPLLRPGVLPLCRELRRIPGLRELTLTTNGVLLDDEVMEFANKEMANIVLSIDGRKEINDRMRPFRGGQGSYDVIVPKFRKVAESRGQERYYVRGTFTRNNPDFSRDVLHLADLGFRQISVEPVVAGPEDDYAIREEDLPALREEYDRLAAEMIKRKKEGEGFNFFHFMIDLEGGPCVAKRLSGCGSGTEYLAVTPWGDLYPCHQFVGEEAFLMGNVFDGLKASELQEEFKGCNVYAKEKCRNCFAKFYCSGGCAANAYKFHGSINDAYDVGCELQRKRIECAVMIKAALAEEDEKEK